MEDRTPELPELDTGGAVAVMIAQPLLDLLNVKIMQSAVNRLTDRDLSFRDAFIVVWAIRIVATSMAQGLRADINNQAMRKQAAAALAKNAAKKMVQRGRKAAEKNSAGATKTPNRVFLG